MFMLTPNSLTLPPATVLLWEAGPAASEISDFHSDEVLVWLEESHFNFDIQVGVFLQESSLIVHRGDKWRCNRCGTYRQTNKRTTREDSATQSMDSGHWRLSSATYDWGIFQLICRWRFYWFTFFESIIWEIGDRKNRERSKKCRDFFPGLRSEWEEIFQHWETWRSEQDGWCSPFLKMQFIGNNVWNLIQTIHLSRYKWKGKLFFDGLPMKSPLYIFICYEIYMRYMLCKCLQHC